MLNPHAVPVDLGFHVADGEDVKIHFEKQLLVLTFTDWREETVSLDCHDAVAFRWQEAEYLLDPTERDDSVYEIADSPWLVLHRDQKCLREGESFHHYKMNFNSAGILEVLCSRIEKEPSDQASEYGVPPPCCLGSPAQ
jgi:hypothetical protein